MVNSYLTREARTYNGVKTVSSINDAGKIGQVYAKKERKKETRLPTYTIYKNNFKVDRKLKSKSQNHKNPRRT